MLIITSKKKVQFISSFIEKVDIETLKSFKIPGGGGYVVVDDEIYNKINQRNVLSLNFQIARLQNVLQTYKRLNVHKIQIDDVNSSINELKNRLNEITILKKKLRLDGKIKQINKNNIALL